MSRHTKLFVAVVVIIVMLDLIGGCASMVVHPWDRDLLAESKMSFKPQPLESAVDDHVYYSREGSTGGQNAGGGGCGCN
jgi:hypothetical protein